MEKARLQRAANRLPSGTQMSRSRWQSAKPTGDLPPQSLSPPSPGRVVAACRWTDARSRVRRGDGLVQVLWVTCLCLQVPADSQEMRRQLRGERYVTFNVLSGTMESQQMTSAKEAISGPGLNIDLVSWVQEKEQFSRHRFHLQNVGFKPNSLCFLPFLNCYGF